MEASCLREVSATAPRIFAKGNGSLRCYILITYQIVLIQVALSTSEDNELEAQVSNIVGRINSKFGTIEYQPVIYLQQDISFPHYLALLSVSCVH